MLFSAAMKDSFIVRLLQDLNIAPHLGLEAEIEDMMVAPEEEMFSDISSVSSPRHFGFECGRGRGLDELWRMGIEDWQCRV